jgi:hypothetical protein
VLLAVLRLDRLLSGWVWHVGGLVVVAGLMVSTTPWAWALAASIGVLVAGLFRLPAWRLAAVGTVLCLASGVAFTVVGVRSGEQARADNRAANEQTYALAGERTPERVLPALLEGIVQGDATAVCGLLDVPARDAFAAAARAPDCASAVVSFRSSAGATVGDYDELDASTVAAGNTWVTNGCRTVWAGPTLGGPDLGQVVVRRSPPPVAPTSSPVSPLAEAPPGTPEPVRGAADRPGACRGQACPSPVVGAFWSTSPLGRRSRRGVAARRAAVGGRVAALDGLEQQLRHVADLDATADALALLLGETVGQHGLAERAADGDGAAAPVRVPSAPLVCCVAPVSLRVASAGAPAPRVARASSVRLTFTRCPIRSSIHIRARPRRSTWSGRRAAASPSAWRRRR